MKPRGNAPVAPDEAPPASFADRRQWARELAHKHGDALFNYACHLTADRERARDAVQETFLRLLREPPEKLAGREAPWLFHVCRTRVLDLARKDKPMQQNDFQDPAHLRVVHEEGEPAPPAPSPALAAETADSARQALDLLARLPPNQREVVRLRFQNGLSYKEIAEVTDFSVSNVGFLLHTALKTLREQMQRAL
jgi:RNA polymerase sigma-70 factor (ECF subfamily)